MSVCMCVYVLPVCTGIYIIETIKISGLCVITF